MSNGGTNGLMTVLAELGATGRVDDADDQAEMFAADDAMPSMISAQSATRSGPRGGRPSGSRNKSTEAWRNLFLSKFRHPMMVLGELTSMTPAELAEQLQLYKFHEGKLVMHDGKPVLATGEAAQMQKDAAIALLPYLAQKLPMAIEITPPKRGVVVIGELPIAAAGGELEVPFAPERQIEQNQDVSEAEIVRPEPQQSHATSKPFKSLGEFKDDV